MNSIVIAAQKVRETFVMIKSNITSQQFVELITASKRCYKIKLRYCTLLTDSEIDFGDKLNDASFTVLDLGYSGHNFYSDFPNYPSRLKNVLKGLGKVEQVRQNLKEINLEDSGLDKAEVEQMLVDCNLNTEVEVTGV